MCYYHRKESQSYFFTTEKWIGVVLKTENSILIRKRAVLLFFILENNEFLGEIPFNIDYYPQKSILNTLIKIYFN